MESADIDSIHQIAGRDALDDIEVVGIRSLFTAVDVECKGSGILIEERGDLAVVHQRTERIALVVVLVVVEAGKELGHRRIIRSREIEEAVVGILEFMSVTDFAAELE